MRANHDRSDGTQQMYDKHTTTLPAPNIEDVEEFAHNLLQLFEVGGRAMANLLERSDGKLRPYATASEIVEAAATAAQIGAVWTTDSVKLAEAQCALIRSYLDLWNQSARRLLGEEVEPLVTPDPSDNRFKDPEWSENPYFDLLEADLSSNDAVGGRHGPAHGRPRRCHASES